MLTGVWSCLKQAQRCVKPTHTWKHPGVDWVEVPSRKPAPWAPLPPGFFLTTEVQGSWIPSFLARGAPGMGAEGWHTSGTKLQHPTQPKQTQLILLMFIKQQEAVVSASTTGWRVLLSPTCSCLGDRHVDSMDHLGLEKCIIHVKKQKGDATSFVSLMRVSKPSWSSPRHSSLLALHTPGGDTGVGLCKCTRYERLLVVHSKRSPSPTCCVMQTYPPLKRC